MAVVRRSLSHEGPRPTVISRCETCHEEGERGLPRSIRAVRADARLPDGRKGDLVLLDAEGAPVLVVQLQSKRRPQSLGDAVAAWPEIVVSVDWALVDPLRWHALRARGLALPGCRCTHARALPIVASEFELRVSDCPIRAGGDGPSHADVVKDCGQCDFYVALRYGDRQKRHPELLCGFSSRRRPPLRAPTPSRIHDLDRTARASR